jgi:hypothetical protein
MRKIITVALVAFAISLIPSTKARSAENVLLGALDQPSASQLMLTALAEPGSPQVGKTAQVTDDLRVSVGYRLWLNFWQTSIVKINTQVVDPDIPQNIINITQPGSSPTIDQFAAASIPSVGVRYKDFFASTSVMISPYYYSTANQIVSGTGPVGTISETHTFLLDHKVRASRIEADINFGYYIHPWIALTMGYKGIFQRFRDQVTEFDISSVHGTVDTSSCPSPTQRTLFCTNTSSKSNTDYNGGTLGIAANIPIPEGGWIPTGFSIYGNGAGGGMGATGFKYALYGTVDVGATYKLTALPLIFSVGYKYQIIRSQTKGNASENHINDYTRGAILGINYVF